MSDDRSHLNRRKFLQYAGIGLAGGTLVSLLAACSSAAAPTPATGAPAAAATPAQAAPTSSGAASKPATTAAPSSTGAKPITVVQAADVPNLDPSRNLVVHVYNVADNVLDTPTYLDRNLKVQPRLATSWNPVDDATWEVKFRTDAKFHDG